MATDGRDGQTLIGDNMTDDTNTTRSAVRIISSLRSEGGGNRLGSVTVAFPSGVVMARLGVIRSDDGVVVKSPRIPARDGKGVPTGSAVAVVQFASIAAEKRFTDAVVDAIRRDCPELLRGNQKNDDRN